MAANAKRAGHTRGRNDNSQAPPDAVNQVGKQGCPAAERSSVKWYVGQHVVNVAALDGGQQLLDAVAAFIEIGHAATRHGEQHGVVCIPSAFLKRSVTRAPRRSSAGGTICFTKNSSRHRPLGPFLKPVAA